MKNTVKITKEQIKGMHEHLSDLPTGMTHKKDLKIFYNPLMPRNIYVRYTTFTLESDNSIRSQVTLNCIRQDGSKIDCEDQFDNLKQRLEFESQFLQIDLDANRNIVFI
jgi:hypothetical protein